MRTQTVSKSLLSLVAALALAVACSTDSPTEPERPPATPPGGGGGGGAFSVSVTANPGTVAAGSDDPVVITVRATQGGQPAPNGTLAVVSALEGSFGALGGPSSVTLELTNGLGQVTFFPPLDEEQSIVVQASVAGSVGQTTVEIAGTATFFVSHVEPASGSPQGGDTVTVVGSGFEEPVRVLFGGTNAQVLSVNPTSIRVRTPPSPGEPNETATVPVQVTINVNEEETATDSVVGAFTYAPGGGDVRQPTVFSVTPTTGPNEGGTPVSIIGEGFQSPVQVRFCAENGDCVEAQVLSVTSGRIEVRSPPATGFGTILRDATADIQVTNLSSGLTTTFVEAFRYGVLLQVTGMQPDSVDAEDPGLVTIFGTGFEPPLAVIVGDLQTGEQQQVVSVTGTEVVFRPDPFNVVGCPEPGAVIGTVPVHVRLLAPSTGPEPATDTSPIDLKFTANIPRPLITGVNPTSGPAGGGTTVTITGSGFDDPVRVLFGGNQANVQSVTAGQARVTSPAFTGTFPTEACTAAGGVPGTRQRPVSVDVTVTNLDTGCTDTASGAFVFEPDDTCVPTEAPPPEDPQCSDGIDNDSDTATDFPDDPQCTDANDDTEAA